MKIDDPKQWCTSLGTMMLEELDCEYAADLGRFLGSRDPSVPFHVGDWLKTIETGRLEQMVDAGWLCVAKAPKGTIYLDILMVASLAYIAETGNTAIEQHEKRIWVFAGAGALYRAGMIELLRRNGAVDLLTPIGVNPDMEMRLIARIPLPAGLLNIPVSEVLWPETEYPPGALH